MAEPIFEKNELYSYNNRLFLTLKAAYSFHLIVNFNKYHGLYIGYEKASKQLS